MTRDEYRTKCLEAMEAAFICVAARDFALSQWGNRATALCREALVAAFDALHGIARVPPVEATEEMHKAGHAANLQKNPILGLYQRIWLAMSAAGDLTNPPEEKP